METRIIYIKDTTHSPNLIEGYTSTESRLIAGKGKALTNGDIICPAIDVPNEQVSLWTEIDYKEPSLLYDNEDVDTLLDELEGLV